MICSPLLFQFSVLRAWFVRLLFQRRGQALGGDSRPQWSDVVCQIVLFAALILGFSGEGSSLRCREAVVR